MGAGCLGSGGAGWWTEVTDRQDHRAHERQPETDPGPGRGAPFPGPGPVAEARVLRVCSRLARAPAAALGTAYPQEAACPTAFPSPFVQRPEGILAGCPGLCPARLGTASISLQLLELNLSRAVPVLCPRRLSSLCPGFLPRPPERPRPARPPPAPTLRESPLPGCECVCPCGAVWPSVWPQLPTAPPPVLVGPP